MEHRLSPATIADLAAKAGLPGTETDRLDQVDLYRFTR
jgi:hypothetical protein